MGEKRDLGQTGPFQNMRVLRRGKMRYDELGKINIMKAVRFLRIVDSQEMLFSADSRKSIIT